MSDTYDFLSLSATEEIEEPGESTMALVLDEGVVKRVPAGKFGGGSCVVNLTTTDGETWTADKNYAELMAAAESGAVPVAIVDASPFFGALAKIFLPLSIIAEDIEIGGIAISFCNEVVGAEAHFLDSGEVYVQLGFESEE